MGSTDNKTRYSRRWLVEYLTRKILLPLYWSSIRIFNGIYLQLKGRRHRQASLYILVYLITPKTVHIGEDNLDPQEIWEEDLLLSAVLVLRDSFVSNVSNCRIFKSFSMFSGELIPSSWQCITDSSISANYGILTLVFLTLLRVVNTGGETLPTSVVKD